jgi:1,4-alpha-glucan branching enzyme/maltooligosyltrehalose trehalohydrolase
MRRADDGWFTAVIESAGPGTLYQFILPDGIAVPDPASRHQPNDVHGPSEVVDLSAYAWKRQKWTGRRWEEMVLYELHVGTYTKEGTFNAVIERLDHLKHLGVTALQIMPIADFPGGYNWGYDGVLPYAPDSSYGRPQDLMALVDAAHERGICVFLDVVYNHFGPDGNYIPLYAPLFSQRHKTTWGNGLNYDGTDSGMVRKFIVENALYWIREYNVDGLRLDAVHAIIDDSQEHLLVEIARRVREAVTDRHVHLIVENENNDSALLKRDHDGHVLHYTAQWNDDLHHVLHVAATHETFGYYGDYPAGQNGLGRALAEGFVFQGEIMPYRGEARGKPTADLPPIAFVSFIQNHDQIGNRAFGDRMITYTDPQALKAITAIYLLLPQIPMLFMGEEWGASTPFPFFCDLDEDLNDIVREGRRKELSSLPGFEGEDIPDPTALSTFLSGKLDWAALRGDPAVQWLAFYQSLLMTRRQWIVPLLDQGIEGVGTTHQEGTTVVVEWKLAREAKLRLMANLSPAPGAFVPRSDKAETIFSLGGVANEQLPPWGILWRIEHP